MKKRIQKKAKIYLSMLLTGTFIIFTGCSKEAVIETIDIIEEAIEEETKLDKLNGNWIRVASNNPTADGILIGMSGTSGTILDKSGSGFSVGDIKWKNIEAVDNENFNHEELGSDYKYYEASMILKADDTLRVSVVSPGAGNVQKWVREGEYTPGEGQEEGVTETLGCSISDSLTLKNGPAAVDYIINCVLDVTAPLTIEPGVVIKFAENAGLGVYDGGTINAVGTLTDPIVFSGETNIKGWWRGIYIETRSSNNILENVTIENAGANYVYCCNEIASLFLKGAKIGIKNLELKSGGGVGLWANEDVEFDEYSNVRIESHSEYPAYISAAVLTALDGNGSDYSANGKNYIFIPNDRIDKITTIRKNNVPYLFEGNVFDITSDLTIEQGVDIIFQENGGLGVYDEGSLNVMGSAAEPVQIRGQEATKGYWRGIHIETNKLANSLNYLNLSDAGGNYVYCCNAASSVLLKNGTTSVTNSTFSNGKGYGIITRPDFEFNTFQANTITTHDEAPMYISVETANKLDGLSSSYEGNTKDFILIYNSDINNETTIRPADVPFQIENNTVIDVTARLNLHAGVEIVFEENSGLGIYDNGVLNALGSPSQKIILRGADNAVGYWRGIHTETNSTSNIIRHSEIRNAGSNYVYCCNDKAALFVRAGQMTIENSLISDSGGCGIQANSNATLMASENTFSNNIDGNLCN